MEEAVREKAAKEDAGSDEALVSAVACSRSNSHFTAAQTELSVMDIGYMEERSREVRVVCESVLTREFLESSSSKVPDVIKFYTGLPSYPRLIAVFNYVSSTSVRIAVLHCPYFSSF